MSCDRPNRALLQLNCTRNDSKNLLHFASLVACFGVIYKRIRRFRSLHDQGGIEDDPKRCPQPTSDGPLQKTFASLQLRGKPAVFTGTSGCKFSIAGRPFVGDHLYAARQAGRFLLEGQKGNTCFGRLNAIAAEISVWVHSNGEGSPRLLAAAKGTRVGIVWGREVVTDYLIRRMGGRPQIPGAAD